MNTMRAVVVGMGALSLVACGGAEPQAHEEEGSAIQLNLSTTAPSGTEYRLGPATFEIDPESGPGAAILVEADGAAPLLHIPLEPDYYRVTLQPGWALSRITGATTTPVAATLTSPAEQIVKVYPFESMPVRYSFHLGESGIDLGIQVDEGAYGN
jgi:hypothetical protein